MKIDNFSQKYFHPQKLPLNIKDPSIYQNEDIRENHTRHEISEKKSKKASSLKADNNNLTSHKNIEGNAAD